MNLERMTEAERTVFEATLPIYEKLFPDEGANFPQEATTAIVTEDFAGALRSLSSPEEIEEYERVGWPDLNAITLPSRESKATFTILFKRKVFEGDAHQHTVPHEITHVSDYSFLFRKYGNLFIASEEDRERALFWPYYQWSEFHSKAVGTKFFSLAKWFEVNGEWPEDGKFSFGQVDFQTGELVRLVEAVESHRLRGLPQTSDKFWGFFRGAMEYLGRMSVFQPTGSTQPPDRSYPSGLLSRIFGPRILELYPLLLAMTNAASAMTRLAELQVLIEDVTTFLNVQTVNQGFGME